MASVSTPGLFQIGLYEEQAHPLPDLETIRLEFDLADLKD